MADIIDPSVGEKEILAYAKALYRGGATALSVVRNLRENLALTLVEAKKIARLAHPLYPYAEYAYEEYASAPNLETIERLSAEIAAEIADEEKAQSLVNMVRIMFPDRYKPL